MKKYLLISCAIALAACAKSPEEITAADLGDGGYSGHSCAQLQREHSAIGQQLATLYSHQRATKTGDTVSVLLTGIPLGSATGGDKETEIAVMKGKLSSVQAVAANKNCTMPAG